MYFIVVTCLFFQGQGLYAQRYGYTSVDSLIAHKRGVKKVIPSFFPLGERSIDSVLYLSPSLYLHEFNERILYNGALGKEIYRFTWLRSFDYPIVIIFFKENDLIKMRVKKGNKVNLDNSVADLQKLTKSERLLLNEYEENRDTIRYFQLYSKAIIEDTIKFRYVEMEKTRSEREWREFERLLVGDGFWDLASNDSTLDGHDGSQWILEANTRKGYHFVRRWSPDKSSGKAFIKACRLLIETSDLRKEKIY